MLADDESGADVCAVECFGADQRQCGTANHGDGGNYGGGNHRHNAAGSLSAGSDADHLDAGVTVHSRAVAAGSKAASMASSAAVRTSRGDVRGVRRRCVIPGYIRNTGGHIHGNDDGNLRQPEPHDNRDGGRRVNQRRCEPISVLRRARRL